jgi:hypothetical protein
LPNHTSGANFGLAPLKGGLQRISVGWQRYRCLSLVKKSKSLSGIRCANKYGSLSFPHTSWPVFFQGINNELVPEQGSKMKLFWQNLSLSKLKINSLTAGGV